MNSNYLSLKFKCQVVCYQWLCIMRSNMEPWKIIILSLTIGVPKLIVTNDTCFTKSIYVETLQRNATIGLMRVISF